MANHAWHEPVRIDDVPETGLHLELEADEATRDALAATAGVNAIRQIQATFEVMRRGRNGLHVTGWVAGLVDQTCIVTLESIINNIDEPIDIEVVSSEASHPGSARNVVVTVDANDPPEPVSNRSVNLGAVAAEFLILGIDPYPRKPGAVFEAPQSEEAAAPNPFAALETLKNKPKDA